MAAKPRGEANPGTREAGALESSESFADRRLPMAKSGDTGHGEPASPVRRRRRPPVKFATMEPAGFLTATAGLVTSPARARDNPTAGNGCPTPPAKLEKAPTLVILHLWPVAHNGVSRPPSVCDRAGTCSARRGASHSLAAKSSGVGPAGRPAPRSVPTRWPRSRTIGRVRRRRIGAAAERRWGDLEGLGASRGCRHGTWRCACSDSRTRCWQRAAMLAKR